MPVAVVTGGAGFLGSHLCDALLAGGMDVLCLDNLCTGRRENIAHLAGEPRFQFRETDICEGVAVDGPVDYILHFASPASPVDYLALPVETLKVGAIGTLNALELAKAKGARLLLASTSEVYGDPLVHPQREDYWGNVNPTGPRGVYDEAKRFAEALVLAYRRTPGLGVATRIARIFNTYGPRMRVKDGRALPNFISQALRGEPVTVYGDGRQTRSFTYVDDLVDGLLRLLLSNEGMPVNLGNPEEASLGEVAREVVELTGSVSEIVCRPLPEDDPKVRCPDIGRARVILGWEPKVGRAEGLPKTIAYFRRELGMA